MEEQFCERLAQLRLAKGSSAREMSLDLGQSAGYINNIENKNNLPSMAMFFCICEYLNITPRDYFDFEAKSPEALSTLIEYLKQLDENQIKNLTAIVKDMI